MIALSIVNSENFETDKVKLKELFANIQLNENIRGESLSIEQFAKLSNLL